MKLISIGVLNGPMNDGVGNAGAPCTDQAAEFPVPDEWECYNLDDEAYEENNLLKPGDKMK